MISMELMTVSIRSIEPTNSSSIPKAIQKELFDRKSMRMLEISMASSARKISNAVLGVLKALRMVSLILSGGSRFRTSNTINTRTTVSRDITVRRRRVSTLRPSGRSGEVTADTLGRLEV